jgi:AbiU2
MVSRTAEEAKASNVAEMGAPLGELYSALWQQIATVHVYWKEYVELFGSKPERIELLNRAAPAFFHMLQDELWDAALLRISRLTDPPKTGRAGRQNLTIQALPTLIGDAALKARVVQLVADAVAEAEFCRDWRNRRIAHNDLLLALQQPTTPLAHASRLQVKAALKSLTTVLNAIAGHYSDSEISFDVGGRINGAVSLLYVLNDGVKAGYAREKRLREGRPTEDDFRSDHI